MQNSAVTHTEWLQARTVLLSAEKAFTKARDELTRQRQALPWELVEKSYTFESPRGTVKLADMFAGRSQLMIYHFMYPADWEQGCKSCSFWADHFGGMLPHLAARDVAFACVSISPLAKILDFKARMGWQFDWYSSAGTSFNRDFGVTGAKGETLIYNYDNEKRDDVELPGLSVFAMGGKGEVFHTYSCYARGLDMLNGTYQFLDLAPKGRDEAGLPYTMSWVRHHDNYGERKCLNSPQV